MYKKSTSSFFATSLMLSLITMYKKIAIRTEFIGLMSIVILALGLMFYACDVYSRTGRTSC